MKQKSIIISCYALLILIGGIIGYFVAHSLISLIVSSAFATLLFASAAFLWKGYRPAYQMATGLVFSLSLFFIYRFFISYKMMPAGMMMLISSGLLAYLFLKRKEVLTKLCS